MAGKKRRQARRARYACSGNCAAGSSPPRCLFPWTRQAGYALFPSLKSPEVVIAVSVLAWNHLANYPLMFPTLQRLYSMFPVGGPGAGLLLLRFSLIASIIYIRTPVIALVPHLAGVAALFAISLCLAAGLMTPVMAGLGVVCGCVALYHGTMLSPWCMASPTLNAIAIFLLGPGAYSVDAILFGRRVLVTPPRRK
jgi:hypothetical protein